MRGLSLEHGVVQYRADLPEPQPRKGWTRVAVTTAGVCATDLALCRGYMDFTGTPGHEFVGVALDGPLQGKRVVGEINASCGSCAWCKSGRDRHCPQRSVLGILAHGGAFAEMLQLPDGNLLEVPEAVSDAAATFTEPLAAALQIGAQIDLPTHRRALVVGDGRLGLLCAHALHAGGCDVTVAGRHPERQHLLPQGIPIVTGLLEDPEGPRAAPANAADAAPFDLAVEATGHPDTLGRLLTWVRPQGVIALKTTTEAPLTVDLSLAVVNELTLLGSRCGRFGPALELLASGRVPVEGFVDQRFPLAQGAEALRAAGVPGTLKVLLAVRP